jgi:hypothetical protein
VTVTARFVQLQLRCSEPFRFRSCLKDGSRATFPSFFRLKHNFPPQKIQAQRWLKVETQPGPGPLAREAIARKISLLFESQNVHISRIGWSLSISQADSSICQWVPGSAVAALNICLC